MGIDDTVKAKPATAPVVQPAQPVQPAQQIKAANPVRTGPAQFRQDISKGIVSPKPVASPYFKPPTRGFWENPQRVARYHNLIRTAPPGWKAPDWLNPAAVKEAYDYMRFRNNFKPVEEWQYLPDDDPGSYFLKDLAAPPNEFLLPGEYGYKLPAVSNVPTQEQIDANKPVDWESLPLYQQILIAALTPEAGLEGRPEWTRATAAAGQALLAAPAGAAIGQMVGGPWLAGGLGLLTFGGTFYQAYTNKEIPGLNDFLQLMDTGAIFAERVIGLGKITGEKGLAELLRVLPEAYKASSLTYETQQTDLVNKLGPAISKPLDWMYQQGWIDEPGGWTRPATEGEVWQFQEGFTDPQKLEGERGIEALLDAAERIRSGEKYDDVYADYVDRFGFTGTLNDFIMQTAIDPANLAPGLGGKAGEIVSRALGNERAAQAFRVNQGSLIIDALPFPLQPIATAVTGLQGAKGVTASWKTYKDWIQQGYYPATMFDMPKDMRTQFNKLVDTGIDPKAIQVSGNKMLWTDKTGKAQEFVGSRQVMIDIPEMEQLSNFEQFVGEVDLTYGIKELKPSVQKSGIARLMSLDPASQSHVLLNVYHQVVANLFNRAHGDPMVMGRMIKQLMGQEQVRAGDPGEMILKSPAARAVRDSVRAAANTAGFEKMLTDWQMVAGSTAPDGSHIPGRRDILLNIANALQRKPAMILEQLQTNPDVLMAEINDKTQITGSPEFLKKTLDVFIGDDALPWNEQQFEAQLVNSIADKMGEYMQKVYGLKPDKGFFRVMQSLKAVQSLVLLNFNPAYFLNNEVNNLATRAATGVFGYMTQGQINKYWERYGMKPPRLDVGASPGDEGATYRPDMISRLKESDDALGKAQKVVSQVTRKLGLFSKLSANFESMESAQAFTIGSKQFMGRSWKRGKGFRKMHPAVERVLNQNFPGMVEVLYSAAEGGLNMQEINDRILGDYVKPSMRASAQAAAAQVFPNAPDVGMDLLEKSGVLDAIESRLDKATTPEEVDAVRRNIESDMRQIISEKWAGDMIAAAEHARTLVEAERIPAVRELMVQYIQRQASMWLNQRREWDHLYSMRDQLTAEQWSTQVENLFNQQDQEWRSHYKAQNQVYDGIAKALSINTQANMDYLAGLTEVSNTWTKFHEDARKLRSDFFRQSKRNSGEKYEDYVKRSSRLWNTLQDTLDELYQKHAAVEDRVQIKMDSYLANGFAVYTGWNPVRVQAWRAYIRALRSDMVRMQREHRRKTRNFAPEERDAAYADFNPVYNKLIADMHRAEIVGAAWIRTQPVKSETLQSAIAEIKKMVKGEEGKAVGITEPEPAIAPDPNAEFITERGEGQVQVSMEWLAVRDAAIAAGMIDKSGNVPTPFLLNVINVHLRSNGLLEVTRQNMYNQSPDVVLKAIQEHVERNQGERKRPVKKQAEVSTTLTDIAKIAELDKREAYIKQKSMLTRRDIIERFHQIPNISPEQIDAAMLKLDMVADQYARRMGLVPSESTRDAYYATRIADVITAFDNREEGQQQVSFYDYLGQLPGDEVIGELYQDVKGSNILQTDGRSLLIMGETADFSTIMHELGHIWRRDLPEADLDTLAKLGGLKDGAELRQLEQAFYFGEAGDLYKEWRSLNQQSASPEGLQQAADVARLQQLAESPAVIAIQKYVDAEEMFTRGLERYLTEGFAPTPALRSLYKRFTDWMLNIYKTLYKKNGRVYGFESGDLSVNITAQVNGVSLRDILDRMFTGEVRRTPTFEILVQGRLEYNQRIPRNINVPLSELTRRARREIVKEVLSSFASIDQAIDYATSMDADVFVTEKGIELDAADLYDAIQVVQNDPLYYDPFAARKQEKQYAAVAKYAEEVEAEAKANQARRAQERLTKKPAEATRTIEEISEAERWKRDVYENIHPSDPRYWYFKDAQLPTEYAKETILSTIHQILGELPEGNVTIIDQEGNYQRHRGGAGTWYWKEYDALADKIKNLRAERAVRAADLRRAKPAERKPILQAIDEDIKAAKTEAGRLHSDYQNALEWLQESVNSGQIKVSKSKRVNDFRSEIMQLVLDRSVTPAETYIPPGTPESEYLNLHMLYDMGQKDELFRILSESGVIETWQAEDYARRGLTEQQADEMIGRWIQSLVEQEAEQPGTTETIEQAGEQAPATEPVAAPQIQAIQARKDSMQADFDAGAAVDFDAIEAMSLQLTAAPVVEGVQPGAILSEGDMLAGLHVHRLTAGRTEAGQEIVAVVYNGDLPVALIPASNETGAFDTAHGQGRVLGLDPYNPNNWVIERDGEITVFDPNDLDVKGGNGEGLYQVAASNAPWYFSQLTRVIEQKMPNKASAEQIRGMLKGVVKEDEIRWTGFDDFLNEHPNPTKQEVLDFLQENNVHVEEVVKSDEIRGITKYDKYVLPGGKNYRELLLTLPAQLSTTLPDGFTMKEINGRFEIYDSSGQIKAYGRNEQSALRMLDRASLSYQGDTYRSPHWAEPNVLAHVRFNDRVGADGRRVLFIEEIQSDWHQAGREKGYNQLSKDENARIEEMTVRLARGDLLSQDEKNWYNATIGRETHGVPAAPFSKSWEELTVKRMIRWASENGYERVAWTTGKMQAKRYNLAKMITKELVYNETKQILTGYSWGKSRGTYTEVDKVFERMGVSPTDLPGYVGKEVSDRLLSVEENRLGNKKLPSSKLEVGGEGMHAFYDEKIPNIVRKYIKKWGAEVGETRLKTGDNVPSFDVTPAMRESVMRDRQALFQEEKPESTKPYNPIGDVQPGSVPSPEPAGAITHEAITEYMNPLVNRMFEHYKANMNRRFKVGDLDPVSQKEVRAWLKQVDNDLSSTKLAAMRYGEQMRDFALLNYSRRYGFDNYLSIGFPYVFWYLRTMMNWGARAFDRPAWFAMYARLRRKQEEQERKGMPSRLRGKVRMPMPWLPDWMGGGIYIDPMKQFFPPAQFGAPLDYAAQQQNQLQRRTEQVLRDMVEQDVITSGEMDEALSTQAGSAWERAFTQAKMETEIDDSPMSLAGMMMQPALWWTIPSKLASGKGEELSPLPITRFGQSVRTALQDTPLQAAGNLAGAIFAGPEEAIREKAGLSKYGEWGDYYVDRMITNLIADGVVPVEEGLLAMNEKRGPAYDLAIRQVEQEMMLRTPGTLPILAVKEGAHPVEVAAAVIASLFPAGLFPTGELKMRGLAAEYNAAWKRFDAGNEEAINQFFEDHPEYEARLALYDEPEERLRQFLVSEIWDRYTSLESMNRKRAGDLLGEEFEQSFLDKDTRSYDSTDIKQLATWAQMLGGMVPQVEQTAGVEPTGEPLDLYTPQEISAVDAYYKERDELYPMATAWQSAYYSLPVGAQRKAFLQSHPQLKKYWDWNTGYKADHPEIQPYLNENAEQRLNEDVNDLSAPLTRQLIAYYFMGKEMTAGAKSELNRIWVSNGSKGGSMEEYMQMLVGSMFGQ